MTTLLKVFKLKLRKQQTYFIMTTTKKFILKQWNQEFNLVLPTVDAVKNKFLTNLSKPKTEHIIWGYVSIGEIYGIDYVIREFMKELANYYGTTVFWQEFVDDIGHGVKIQVGKDAYQPIS